MNKIKSRILELRKIINKHNHNYYDLDLFKMLQKYNIKLKITPKFFIKSMLKTIKFNLKKLLRYG